MSNPEDNTNPPSYETIMTNSESTPPMSNVPLTSIPENESPPPPAYFPPYPTQGWCPHSVTPPWSVDNMTTQNTDSSPSFHKTFLKGKPKALGIVIIVAAIVEIALGIALAIIAFTNTVDSGIPFWGPVFYIISGSLTLASYQKPSISMIKVSLSVTCLSWFISAIAVILNVIDLAMVRCFFLPLSNNVNYNDNYGFNGNNDYDDLGEEDNHHNGHHNDNSHHDKSSYETQCPQRMAGVYAVLALLLINNLLIFFVTLFISAYGCRSISETQSTAPQVYVIPNEAATKKPDAVPEFSVILAQPPPYTANEIRAIPQY